MTSLTLPIFAFTLFVSAFLLFLVQPMIGKMILPKFGGTPAVWNTCMVFFQALLLAGYGYAHASTNWLGKRRQTALHLLLLLVPFVVLPLAITQDPPGDANPAVWLLWLLLLSVGLPFLLVATSAPLLQKWFAETGHPAAKDPYFLYAASNLGSLLALLAYPTVIEPYFRLLQQSHLWTSGYSLLVLLTAGCGVILWRASREAGGWRPEAGGKQNADIPHSPLPTPHSSLSAPTLLRRLHWIALAFVPSSLLLGVTTYLSTDVAAFPLIWVVPLTLYLLSFILVFSRLPSWVHSLMTLALPLCTLLLILVMMMGVRTPMLLIVFLHLATLFIAAMVCHGELAQKRPETRYLTEFYLWMSFGGVLGGIFNALVAPLVFKTTAEYSLGLAAACLLMPPRAYLDKSSDADDRPNALTWFLDFLLPTMLGVLTVGAMFWTEIGKDQVTALSEWLREHLGERAPGSTGLANFFKYGVPAMLCFTFASRPIRFGLGIGAIMLASAVNNTYISNDALYRHRSFFGVLKVTKNGDYHQLIHGTILHGTQEIDKMGVPIPYGFRLREWSLDLLKEPDRDRVPDAVAVELRSLLADAKITSEEDFVKAFGQALAPGEKEQYESLARRWYRRDRLAAKLQPLVKQHFATEEAFVDALGQVLSPEEMREYKNIIIVRASLGEPLTYYHRTGPIGQLFTALKENGRKGPTALVGLGTGSLAYYGQRDQEVTFYEIDAAVKDIAENPAYFAYVEDAKRRGVRLNVVLGDARLSLQKPTVPDGHYQVIVIDAFSSDAIPIHLITREALQAYRQKLAPDGIVAFHISNRYLDLEPVLANLAEDAGLKGLVQHDSKEKDYPGKAASTWVLLARTEADFRLLAHDIQQEKGDGKRWYRLEDHDFWEDKASVKLKPKVGVWSDDFSNILSVLKW